MTEITMIPLSKLTESEDNVRKTNRKGGIGELAASIRAHGLLQSLVVRETENGRYGVIAGGRRLRALRLLAKAGDIEKTAPIPCAITSGDNAAELSLAENLVRQQMEAADEIEAFAQRIEAGEGPEAIASRFGVSPRYVARRLKLARVSPRLMAALRKNEIDLDQLAALALTDDHERQNAAFFDAPDWARTPDRLRAQITRAHVPETDKLARFVGMDPYKAEGGATVSDLFTEEDDPALWLTNRDLLVRLAEAKLQPIADTVRGEGWAWVEIAMDEIGWQRFPARVREQRRTLSKREQARLERLYGKLDEAEDPAEIEAIETQIDALAPTTWVAEEVALAGAVVTLTRDGTPRIERGLVRQEDMKALKALRRKAERAEAHGDSEGDDAGAVMAPQRATRLSAKLIEELQAHKTLALRAVLAEQPDAALRVLVFTLAERFVGGLRASPLGLEIEEKDVARSITRRESKAPEVYEAIAVTWRDRLPAEPEDLWRFIADAEQQSLLALLAVLIAPGLDLRADTRGSNSNAPIGDLIAEAVGLDMSVWWTASPDSYFNHVKRDVILDAIREHKPALCVPKLEKASRAELVARTKRIFKRAGWLPEMLRIGPGVVEVKAEAIAAE